MKIKIEHSGFKMEALYDDENGRFMYILNLETDKKMMVEKLDDGNGFTINRNTFLVSMDVCDARYYRVMDADLFIPSLIFIPNTKK